MERILADDETIQEGDICYWQNRWDQKQPMIAAGIAGARVKDKLDVFERIERPYFDRQYFLSGLEKIRRELWTSDY